MIPPAIIRNIASTFIAGTARGGNVFGPGSGPIVWTYLDCSGVEANLLECDTDGRDVQYCHHSNDIGVTCEGSLFFLQ